MSSKRKDPKRNNVQRLRHEIKQLNDEVQNFNNNWTEIGRFLQRMEALCGIMSIYMSVLEDKGLVTESEREAYVEQLKQRQSSGPITEISEEAGDPAGGENKETSRVPQLDSDKYSW